MEKDILLLLMPFVFIFWGLYGLYSKENKNFYIILISFGLSTVAFYTLPNPSDDLQRHFDVIKSFENEPLGVIFYSGYPMVYLNNLIMYLISLTGIPNLYTMLFTFVGYYFIFKLILDIYNDKKNISNVNLLILIVFVFLLSFYKTYILAIRIYFCFIIGIYLLYKFNKKEIKCWTYYLSLVILAFIHPVAMVLCIFPLFLYVNKTIKYLILFGILFNKFIIQFVLSFLSHDNFIYIKLNAYMGESVLAYNRNFMILYFILIIFSALIIYYSWKTENKYSQLLLLATVLSVSTCYQFDLIRRFIYLLPLLLPLPLFNVLESDNKLFNIPLKYICYFFMLGLSMGSIIATVANIRAYGWYLIF